MRRSRKQNEILLVSTKLFAENGYAETSIRDIAEIMDLKPASLYSHIDSKEQLLEWICEDVNYRFTAIVDEVKKMDGDNDQKFYFFIKRHLQEILKDYQRFKVYERYWMTLNESKIQRYTVNHMQYFDYLGDLIKNIVDYDFSPWFNDRALEFSLIEILASLPEWIKTHDLSEDKFERTVEIAVNHIIYGFKGVMDRNLI